MSNLQASRDGLVDKCSAGAKEGSFSCRQTIRLLGTQMISEDAGLSFGNAYWPDKEVLLTVTLEQIVKYETEK